MSLDFLNILSKALVQAWYKNSYTSYTVLTAEEVEEEIMILLRIKQLCIQISR